MTDLHPRKRRPTACIPCHQRKVRCDAATNGTPCSRCISKDVVQDCTLVPPRASKRGSTRPQTHPLNSTRGRKNSNTRPNRVPVTDAADSFGTIGSPAIPDELTQFHEPQGPATEILSYQSITTPTSNITGESLRNSHTSVPNYAVSEEDAHVQTLHRMTDGNDAIPSPARISDEPHNYEVVEYFDNLNSVSILGEALGRRQTRRLIQLDLSPRYHASAEQRALSNLDPADANYLCSRGVFKTPPRAACVSLVQLWFKHVYPYTPVLDRMHFYEDFVKNKISHFLLFAILANVIPYASHDLIQAAGYSDRNGAQRDFSSKAQLLHDFGCERRQMVLLQGSCILSSFQVSYAPTKDFRFWLHNAFRIATQMGLHRKNLADDLDPQTYRLCLRIWWMIYARDVLFNLSGFANSRCVDDREVDIYLPQEKDWPDEDLPEDVKSLLGSTTSIHKAYFSHNCKLALLGGKFLRFSRNFTSPITEARARRYADEMSTWRNDLPAEFSTNHVSSWTSDNVWVLFLLALSYRLECFFYRTARKQFKQNSNQEGIDWCKSQLTGCVFELDTLMSRAIEHDVLKYAPASLIVCACNLLAFHMEYALDLESKSSRRYTAKARINALLSYFEEAGENWQMAKWTFRVSEWVVKQAGLRFDEDTITSDLPKSVDQQSNDWNCGDQSTAAFSSIPAPFAPFFTSESLFAFGDTFPDPWLQNLFGNSSYS